VDAHVGLGKRRATASGVHSFGDGQASNQHLMRTSPSFRTMWRDNP